MLLKAGMSIKQALFYNIASSILALIGVMFGVFLGTDASITPWIFSITAGVFLYIALVDMAPELSSGHLHPLKNKHSRGQCLELFLQIMGMLMGVGIMLVIALYEEKIHHLVEDEDN